MKNQQLIRHFVLLIVCVVILPLALSSGALSEISSDMTLLNEKSLLVDSSAGDTTAKPSSDPPPMFMVQSGKGVAAGRYERMRRSFMAGGPGITSYWQPRKRTLEFAEMCIVTCLRDSAKLFEATGLVTPFDTVSNTGADNGPWTIDCAGSYGKHWYETIRRYVGVIYNGQRAVKCFAVEAEPGTPNYDPHLPICEIVVVLSTGKCRIYTCEGHWSRSMYRNAGDAK